MEIVHKGLSSQQEHAAQQVMQSACLSHVINKYYYTLLTASFPGQPG